MGNKRVNTKQWDHCWLSVYREAHGLWILTVYWDPSRASRTLFLFSALSPLWLFGAYGYKNSVFGVHCVLCLFTISTIIGQCQSPPLSLSSNSNCFIWLALGLTNSTLYNMSNVTYTTIFIIVKLAIFNWSHPFFFLRINGKSSTT